MSRYGVGNQGHYRGTDATELIRAYQETQEARFAELAQKIINLVGPEEYTEWVDRWPDRIGSAETAILYATVWLADLEAEECECVPVGDGSVCDACRHQLYRWSQHMKAQDYHLEAAYEERYQEADF